MTFIYGPSYQLADVPLNDTFGVEAGSSLPAGLPGPRTRLEAAGASQAGRASPAMPHGRGLPSGERPSRLRAGHDRRAVQPRSCPPDCRRRLSDVRCRGQRILRLRASHPSPRADNCSGVSALLRGRARHHGRWDGREVLRHAIHPRGWPGRVREGGTPLPIYRHAVDGGTPSAGAQPRGDRAANPQGLQRCALLASVGGPRHGG